MKDDDYVVIGDANYETDIIKLREIVQNKELREEAEKILLPHLTQFELKNMASEDDVNQFKADWVRSKGIRIKDGSDSYYILPSNVSSQNGIDLAKEDYPIVALRDHMVTILGDYKAPTLNQVDRIVQHFSQRSITALGYGQSKLVLPGVDIGEKIHSLKFIS